MCVSRGEGVGVCAAGERESACVGVSHGGPGV